MEQHGLGVLVKRGDALLNRFRVVIDATAALASLEKSLRHCLIRDLEIDYSENRLDLSVKAKRIFQMLEKGVPLTLFLQRTSFSNIFA